MASTCPVGVLAAIPTSMSACRCAVSPSTWCRGTAEGRWTVELDVVDRDGVADFRGPAVQGRPGGRFVYLTWGDVTDGAFTMFRRLKIMLADLPSTTQDVVATIRLTDAGGMPLCARARPPHLSWTVASDGAEPTS